MEASTNLGNLTDLEMVERHRASFNGKIAQMQDVASKNSKFMTRADQDKKVERLLALNNLDKRQPKEPTKINFHKILKLSNFWARHVYP